MGDNVKCAVAVIALVVIAAPGMSLAAPGGDGPSNNPSVIPAYMSDSQGRVMGPLVAPASTAKVPAAQAVLWRSPWGNIKVQFRASGPGATPELSYLAAPSLYFASRVCTGPAYVLEADLWSFVPGFSRAFVADDVGGTYAAPGPTIGTVYLVGSTSETITPRGVRSQFGHFCDAMLGMPIQMFKLQAVGHLGDFFVGPYLVK
jgi:hypothetical protein